MKSKTDSVGVSACTNELITVWGLLGGAVNRRAGQVNCKYKGIWDFTA